MTAEQVQRLTGQLWPWVERQERVLVLLDRTAMTAPTEDGRAAVEELFGRWDEVAPFVAGWADVYDERRARSLARAAGSENGAHDHGDDDHGHDLPYPHAFFSGLEEARAWLRGLPV